MAVVVIGGAWRVYVRPLATWVDETAVLWLRMKHLWLFDAMVGSMCPGVGCHGKSRAGFRGKLVQKAR